MFCLVYKITNTVNGKLYIGVHQTTNVDDGYMGSGVVLQRAFKKHGLESFTKEIMFTFETSEEMYLKEAELVNEEFVSRADTYNLKVGGTGGWDYVNRSGLRLNVSDAQKEAARDHTLARGRKAVELRQDPEHRERWVNALSKSLTGRAPTFKGSTHSNETKALIGSANSKHQTGQGNSQWGTCWVTDGSQNKKIKAAELQSWLDLDWRRGRK